MAVLSVGGGVGRRGQGGEQSRCHMMAPGSIEMSLQQEERQARGGGDSLGVGDRLAYREAWNGAGGWRIPLSEARALDLYTSCSGWVYWPSGSCPWARVQRSPC